MTLYGGARGGGNFEDASGNGDAFKLDSGAAVSASIDWQLDDGREGQLFYSFQRSALPGRAFGQSADVAVNISYLHLGGRVFFEGDAGTVAAMDGRSAPRSSRPGSAGCRTRSGRFGEPRHRLAVVADPQRRAAHRAARLPELINSNGEFLCSGGCVISLRGRTLGQAEGLVGLSIGFSAASGPATGEVAEPAGPSVAPIGSTYRSLRHLERRRSDQRHERRAKGREAAFGSPAR